MKKIRLTIQTYDLLSNTIKIGIPVAIQSALVAILSLSDIVMVGSFGEKATAAVGLASKWHFVAIMIMAGLSTANGILVTQFWGKHDRSTAKAITLLTAKIGVWILVPISLIFVLFADNILRIQTIDIKVIELGRDYLLYASPVLIITHLVIVIESTMRSTGDSLTPLLISAVTIIINISLNYCLISGKLGLEPMGVSGAALATTLARLFQILTFAVYFQYRHHWLKITVVRLNINMDIIKKTYIALAVPAVISALLWAVGTMFYQIIIGHIGTRELAVYCIMGPFESLCYALFFGLSVACSVIIGQNLGRHQFNTAIETSRFFTKIFAFLGIATTCLLFLFQPWLLSILGMNSEQYLSLSKPAMTILSIGISLKMLNMVIINGILKAGGENAFCLRIDFISTWLIGLPITALAAFIMKYDFQQVYTMMLIEEVIKLKLCWHRYRKNQWLRDLTTSE